MTPRQVAKLLGFKLDFDAFDKKGEAFSLHQVKRRIRYYCFALQRKAVGEDDKVRVPKKLIEYFEGLPEFEGWHTFAETWDVVEAAPYKIYFRDFSIHQEWDATLRRVVPELPVDRSWRQNGPKSNV